MRRTPNSSHRLTMLRICRLATHKNSLIITNFLLSLYYFPTSAGYCFRYLRMVGLRPLLAGCRFRYPSCVRLSASIAPSLSLAGYRFRYLRMVELRPLLAGCRFRYPRCVGLSASIAPSLSLLGIIFDTCEWLGCVLCLPGVAFDTQVV